MSKNHLALIAVTATLSIVAFVIGRSCGSAHPPTEDAVVIDSVTTEDVVADPSPVPRDSVVIRYRYVDVPIQSDRTVDTIAKTRQDDVQVITNTDTATVIIPIIQRKYETEDYRAYVSGYHPSLDSIFVKRKTTTVTIREKTKPPKFSIGLQVGYGMTPKGFQPYVGVGVSVNLWSK